MLCKLGCLKKDILLLRSKAIEYILADAKNCRAVEYIVLCDVLLDLVKLVAVVDDCVRVLLAVDGSLLKC